MTPHTTTIARFFLHPLAVTALLARVATAAPLPAATARHAITINTARIEEAVRAEMTAQRIPGVSVAVVRGGEIKYAKGFGLANVEHNVPVRPETVFQSGSVGKQFTATAVMMLVEQGRIGLDDGLAKYFPQAPEAWKGITIRRLLTHTSGMTDYPSGFDFRRDYTEDELIARGMAIPLAFPPGAKWSYSNLGYVTLGVLIHKVTGEFYGDFLQERIFRPLGMTTARIIDEADIVPNRAAGYRLVKGELKNQEWVSPTLNTTADGALYLTTLDMAKWDAALYTEKLLKKASLDAMWTPVRLNDGTTYPYGFGWTLGEVRGHRVIEHGGSWQGFQAYISRYVDDSLTIVAFDNLAGSRLDRIVARVAAVCDPELTPPDRGHIEAGAPPVAVRVPKVLELHGTRRADDYDWMRDKADPRLASYLDAENAYAAAVMKPTEALQATIFFEILGRLKPEEDLLPVEENGYLYFTRFEKGKEYPVYCRRKAAPGARDEVMLDANEQAAGHALYKSSQPVVSPDNRRIAFAADTSGDRVYTVRFKDLVAGTLLPDVLTGTAGEVVWAADSRSVLYSAPDASIRTYRVVRHVLGTPAGSDVVLYQEDDPMFEVALSRSKSRAYAIIDTSSETTSEVRYLDLADPGATPALFQHRTPGREYRVDHGGGAFFIRTNLDAPDFRLMQAETGKTAVRDWKAVMPAEPGVLLEEFELFDGYVVLLERAGGLPRLRTLRLADHTVRQVPFREEAYDVGLEATPEYQSRSFRFRYSSPVVPNTVYEVDLASGVKLPLRRDEVLGGYDEARYEARRVQATAPDGTKVPISLVMQRGLRLDGKNPLLLLAYGAYGSTSSFCRLTFQPERLSLLDRGFVVAVAHVRGGSELGRAWYEDGKLLHKKNTYSDFIACAERLVALRYTSPATLFADGISAGGMLMAVAANWRPDLFKGIVAEVPWTDVVTDSLDPSLPLVTVEYEEWGNPGRKADFDYLLSYSPYDNVKAQAYPAMLVTGAFNDTQVMVWNPAKWVAKLRATKTDDNPLLLITNMASGHSGASGRLERYRLTALKYAFVLQLAGIDR